ncbi:protoporphyrinogen oxidase [Pontibacter sp. G13]|uniref:protoporphyrinogen oxidase n=1 Tax=Pontibacter sp. G13 TaxID=3074898 RepID=UPI002889344B|nr:protoporphyrinogen oxidase [Pontibacter sp. G13]WNJ20932.1 protoporphyrinogen oxidase [Pontibacter sp. G13]
MITIIGAGLTGLTAGYTLKQAGVPYRIIEATQRSGGNIQSSTEGPYTLESGPNTLQLNDEIYGFLEELGLADDIQAASPAAKYRFILKNGVYRKLPTGPLSLLFGSTLTGHAKRKIWKERTLAAGGNPNETVDSFFRRRFGDEIADYLVAPFISGIFAGDARALLLNEAFPQLADFESNYGSVIRGMMKSRKKQEHKGPVSFKGGLQRMTDRLAELQAEHIQYNTPVTGIRQNGQGFEVLTESEVLQADQVICTVPAHILAPWMEESHPTLAAALQAIKYPPVSVVHTSLNLVDLRHKLAGFGALHNHLEHSNTLGSLFISTLFPDRCPEEEVLITTFVGGQKYPKRAQQSDNQLKEAVLRDYSKYLGLRGKPSFQKVVRWEKAIPQYDERIRPAHAEALKLADTGLRFGGNWIGGISLPACIANGKSLAQSALESRV